MEQKMCNNCKGPITEVDGKYVCAICGAVFGNVVKPKDYSEFFSNTHIEKIIKLNRRLTDTVVLHEVNFSKDENHVVYIIARLADGQFYVQFNPQEGFHHIYRGQCDAEVWGNVKSIYASDEYTVGINMDGTLHPTLIELEQLFNRIKASGISDMRMRKLLSFDYQHSFEGMYSGTINVEDQFFGIDINGKVVIYNPYALWYMKGSDDEGKEEVLQEINWMKSLPPITDLGYLCGVNYAIADNGKVYTFSMYPEHKGLEDALSTWNDIDNISKLSLNDKIKWKYKSDGFAPDEIVIGLKKDGTLVSFELDTYTSIELVEYNDLEAKKRYLGTEFYENRKIIQVEIIDCGEYKDYGFLTSRGEFIYRGEKIADNVLAIFPLGYVHADGSLYELVCKKRMEYRPVERLKLFESIETALEENEESLTKKLHKDKEHIGGLLQNKCELLNKLEKQYSALGLFQCKEKKKLRPFIQSTSQEISDLKLSLEKIDLKIQSLSGSNARWHKIELPEGNVSIDDLRTSTYNAVTFKNNQKSVIGNAALGAVVAGPAGAIVGAIYALDKNNNKKNNS